MPPFEVRRAPEGNGQTAVPHVVERGGEATLKAGLVPQFDPGTECQVVGAIGDIGCPGDCGFLLRRASGWGGEQAEQNSQDDQLE